MQTANTSELNAHDKSRPNRRSAHNCLTCMVPNVAPMQLATISAKSTNANKFDEPSNDAGNAEFVIPKVIARSTVYPTRRKAIW